MELKAVLTPSGKTKWFPELNAFMFYLNGHVLTSEIYI